MKECEWCGIDFRGEYKSLEEHVFCSDGCLDEWRKDVLGETEAPSEPIEPQAEGSG